jgi:hypothetical protein
MSKITPNDRGGQRLDSMAPALNDYRDVKAALEQLGSQYDPDRGWTKVIYEEADSNALAVEVLRHMGGNLPAHWREAGMIRCFLREIAGESEDQAA